MRNGGKCRHWVCVCVCDRERERGREQVCDWSCSGRRSTSSLRADGSGSTNQTSVNCQRLNIVTDFTQGARTVLETDPAALSTNQTLHPRTFVVERTTTLYCICDKKTLIWLFTCQCPDHLSLCCSNVSSWQKTEVFTSASGHRVPLTLLGAGWLVCLLIRPVREQLRELRWLTPGVCKKTRDN